MRVLYWSLNFVSRLIQFFSSKHYNNLKYNYSTVALTKLIFEKTTKTAQSFKALGNVYRNSKWSDLNVFNIKPNFNKQFKQYITLALSLFIILLLITNFYMNFNLLSHSIIIELFITAKDMFASWIIALLYTVQYCVSQVVSDLFKYTRHVVVNPNISKLLRAQRITQRITKPRARLNSFNTYLDESSLPPNTQMLLKGLHHINKHKDKLKDAILSIKALSQFKELIAHSATFGIRSKDSFFCKSIKNDVLLKQHNKTTSLCFLRSLPVRYYITSYQNILQNTNLSKESKWLSKNSILGHELNTKVSSSTHVKKLYGNPVLSSAFSLKNIWASTKLSSDINSLKVKSTAPIKQQTNLYNHFLTAPTTKSLNFLEESFFWVVKRSWFLQSFSNSLSFNIQSQPNKLNLSKEDDFKNFQSQVKLFTHMSILNDSHTSLCSQPTPFRVKHLPASTLALSKILSEGSEFFHLSDCDIHFTFHYSANPEKGKSCESVFAIFK